LGEFYLSPIKQRSSCGDLELTPGIRDEYASYIEWWVEVVKNDKASHLPGDIFRATRR
jgi:hypothetical protein